MNWGGLTPAAATPLRSKPTVILAIVVGVLAAVASLFIIPPAEAQVGPFKVQFAWTLEAGRTRLEVPPFGALSAQTHMAPVGLRVELRQVDVDELQRTAAVTRSEVRDYLLVELRGGLEAAARRFGLRTVAIAAGIGFGAAMLIATLRRRLPAVLIVVGVSVSIPAASFSAVTISFNADGFKQPEYTGALQAAPWMVGLAEQAVVEADRLGERLTTITENLVEVFARLERSEPVGANPGDRTILVVSDIHNNPVAFDLIKATVQAFGPDLVIDAGDITDWGTMFEGRLLDSLTRLPVPYVFIPGNHETPVLIERLQELDNVVVIQDGVVEVAGVNIAAVGDPAASSTSPRVAARSDLLKARTYFRDLVSFSERTPDVAVAHHPEIARAAVGKVATVISGHTHRQLIEQERGTLHVNPGSTGAAGIRGLEGRPVPYGLLLLHLRADGQGGWLPLAVDEINLSNFHSGFALARHVFSAEYPQTEGSLSKP